MAPKIASFGNWECVKQLGSGGFGEVFVWKNRKNEKEIATKRLKRDNSLLPDQIAKIHERWKKEFEWTQCLESVYIVRGLKIEDEAFLKYLQKNQSWPDMPIIIMEYCDGGDLRTYLQKPQNLNGLCEYEVREVLTSLRHAIEYLHEKCNIEHRDLKPDNIVIAWNGTKRVFKLIDFGFARQVLTNQTILQSHVGTRHYFAPEILTGGYKKSVDYWSMGVIAFETICGVLPFIPHQSIQKIYEQIMKKDRSYIAITESITEPLQFESHITLFPQNHLTNIFADKIEKWLRMALDSDYKKRGYSETQLNAKVSSSTKPAIFTDLDEILLTAVLKVFCLNTFEFYTYELLPSLSMADLFENFKKDMLIKQPQIILPIGHPCKELTPDTKPIDLYVETWLDSTNDSNPPVMLYVIDQCDYNETELKLTDAKISPIIKQCMRLKFDKVPKFGIYQFALHTHYLLSLEQQRLEAIMMGLKEHALYVQELLLHFNINELSVEIALLYGITMHSLKMVESAQHANREQLSDCEDFFKKFIEFFKKIENVCQRLLFISDSEVKRHRSVLRRITEESKNPLFDELIKKDIYKLKQFRKQLAIASRQESSETLYVECESALKHCLKERERLITGKTNYLRTSITNLNTEYLKIKEIFESTKLFIYEKRNEIDTTTMEFQTQLNLLLQKYFTRNTQKESLISSYGKENEACSYIQGPFNPPAPIFTVPTQDLLENVNATIQLLSLEMDEYASFPMTINDLTLSNLNQQNT